MGHLLKCLYHRGKFTPWDIHYQEKIFKQQILPVNAATKPLVKLDALPSALCSVLQRKMRI